ncbi:RNA-binding protein [Candidatus Geothermarchaeota archaeon]|nr:MAG: RNA-binding protein [Candidatus Geothermarchaeota archaeon]HEW93559.1 RNA-binding protein [Thermoprotei archaeon]
MPIDLTIRLLKRSLNKPVIVKIKGGRLIRGILVGYDEHLNLLLKDAEWVYKEDSDPIGSILLRGDNVVLISPT